MTPMSPVDLRAHVINVVAATTPRIAYGDGDAFREYVKPAQGKRPGPVNAAPPASGQRSRRFRVEFGPPTARRSDGLWTGSGAEHDVTLRLLVDYAATEVLDAVRELVARDDMMLLRERLCASAAPNNGVQLAEELDAADLGPIEDPNIRTFALTFNLRYYAALSPGA